VTATSDGGCPSERVGAWEEHGSAMARHGTRRQLWGKAWRMRGDNGGWEAFIV
jgi:hypothetical protein